MKDEVVMIIKIKLVIGNSLIKGWYYCDTFIVNFSIWLGLYFVSDSQIKHN